MRSSRISTVGKLTLELEIKSGSLPNTGGVIGLAASWLIKTLAPLRLSRRLDILLGYDSQSQSKYALYFTQIDSERHQRTLCPDSQIQTLHLCKSMIKKSTKCRRYWL